MVDEYPLSGGGGIPSSSGVRLLTDGQSIVGALFASQYSCASMAVVDDTEIRTRVKGSRAQHHKPPPPSRLDRARAWVESAATNPGLGPHPTLLTNPRPLSHAASQPASQLLVFRSFLPSNHICLSSSIPTRVLRLFHVAIGGRSRGDGAFVHGHVKPLQQLIAPAPDVEAPPCEKGSPQSS